MNLVQQQEALRTLPIPVLQAKAQGQDPSIPAWLATAVLNERMSAQQKAGLAQGAAQGQQPSVAEQLEQKAGLMALQAQQQQQAQQQMMQQMSQAPQAVPQEVPQPQAQPQPPAMMASGGIARLPIDPRMFNYKEGGVIGFAGGGDINAALREFLRSVGMSASEFANADTPTRNKVLEAFRNATQGPRPGPAVAPSALPAATPKAGLSGLLRAATVPAAVAQGGYDLAKGATQTLANMSPDQRTMLESAGGGDDTAMAAAILNAAKPPPEAPPALAPPEAGDMGARDRGLASLQNQQPSPPPAPRPTPRPAPAPMAAQPTQPPQAAGAAPSELQGLMMGALKKEPKAMSVDEALAEYNAATPAERKQPAGLEMLARLKQQQAQYEKSKESLPMENWMRGLAAAARGGIGGFGMADIENTERNRAADAAQADYQNKVMTAVEAMRRGEATEQQKAILDRVGKSSTATSEAERNRLTQLTSARSSELSSQTQKEVGAAHDATSLQIARIQAAAASAARAQGMDDKQVQMAEAAFARDPEAASIKKQLESSMYTLGAGAAERSKPLLERLRKIQEDKYQQFGIKLQASPGAAKAPAQDRPPLGSFQK